MAKIIKKNSFKKDDSSHEERLMVLVENLGDQIKLVAEGNLMLQEKMEAGFKETGNRFDALENRIDSIENRMGAIEDKFGLLEKDMRGGFKMTVEYLSRIEEEIAEIKIDLKRLEEKKADKEAMLVFEKRIARLERELEGCKNFCKNK